MNNLKDILSNINEDNFEKYCLQIFEYQYINNEIYNKYCRIINKNPENINCITDIPFLPITLFKQHKILSSTLLPELVFESSTTTQQVPSKHYIVNKLDYEISFVKNFKHFYGDISSYNFLALLPSYQERGNSSLVYMVDYFIKKTNKLDSGFFMYNFLDLYNQITKLELQQQKYILIGVSFALLDFAEQYHIPMRHGIVIETGGMKGRRKEILREELHEILSKSFDLKDIHSEYGMTEMLSQAYSQTSGIFNCPPQMQILIREPDNPFEVKKIGKGAINVIDLANINSCSFLATDDIGEVYENKQFKITGRLKDTDIRGCNLMTI